MTKRKTFFLTITFAVSLFFNFLSASTIHAAEVRSIIFPVVGAVSYSDDFGDPRTGHTHEGNDIMGKKLMPLIAAVDGMISFTPYPEPSYGYMISIRDKDGYTYNYLHVNNDNPGTDDGKGGGINAYAPDILDGNPVVKGQLVGWMGDSGNAEGTQAHLHFEIRAPDGTAFSPYESLKAALKFPAPLNVYPQLNGEVLPYGTDFTNGANIAVGKFDSSSVSGYVTAPASKGGPNIKVYDAQNQLKSSFMAYDPLFNGGVDVATGDVDGDGIDEIITAPNTGGGPHVKIFKANGTLVGGFMAYAPNFHGGIRVSTVDTDNDKKSEIVTAPGAGGGPHVKIFKAEGTVVSQFMAYDPNFRGGLDLAGVSAISGRTAKIVTSPAPGGGPHVRVFNTDGTENSAFMAYDPNFHGGVKVSVGNVSNNNSELEILTVPFSSGGPHVRMFDLSGNVLEEKLSSFEPWWVGGYDIAAADGAYYISTGLQFENHVRRASVRQGNFKTSGSGFRKNFFTMLLP